MSQIRASPQGDDGEYGSKWWVFWVNLVRFKVVGILGEFLPKNMSIQSNFKRDMCQKAHTWG